MMTATATTITDVRTEDDHYEAFLASLRARFAETTADGSRLCAAKLFTTNATGLFEAFLAELPPDRRQHYTCNACRRFVEHFGGLVTVMPSGEMVSVLWDPHAVPQFFEASVHALARTVARSRITGVFLSEEKVWGMPVNRSSKPPGSWHHMAVTSAPGLLFEPSLTQTTSQAIAEKLQDYQTLCRGLDEFSIDVVRQAHSLLTMGALYRSEKCIGVAKWLLDLHEVRKAAPGATARYNLTWLAVATAPAGFCHIRSTMIGTLLEDIATGMPFEDIKRRFDEKMNPLAYQRPQAAPSAGNIAQAEAIVAKLASAGSLARRFAKLEEIQTIWKSAPPKVEAPRGGVFSHLAAKGESQAALIEHPPVIITWEKFARTVLPEAEQIEFFVPSQRAPYAALVTAVNPDAPPILQWGNSVSWYMYWNLTAGRFHPVTAIAFQKHAHHGQGVFMILDGARDVNYTNSGGFFPELLRSEYHAIRATMEAYAKSAVVEGAAEATACGIKLQKDIGAWGYEFRVTSRSTRITYKFDRWD